MGEHEIGMFETTTRTPEVRGMYRIEVSPGEETVFRTIDELATGIRNGVITSRSRIYHGASAKWLPIEFHPHYKKAADLAAHPPSATDHSHSTPAPAQRHSVPVPAVEPKTPVAVAPAFVRPAPMKPAPPQPAPIQPAPLQPAPIQPAPIQPAPSQGSSAEPGLVLPKISYPEVPREEPQWEEQPRFRGRRRMGRPFVLGAMAIVVAVGARFILAAAPPAAEPELPTTTLGSSPVHIPEPEPEPVTPRPAPAPAPVLIPAPPRSSSAPRAGPMRMTVPGPAFAPALPASSALVPAKPTAKPVAPAKGASADTIPPASIEPAPAQIDLSLPRAMPSTDSIVIPKSADSNAMRRILKAVTGSKAQPTKAGGQ